MLDHASIMSEIIPSLFVGCLPEPQVEVGCRSLDWRTKRSGTRKESPHHVMIDEPIERFDGDQAAKQRTDNEYSSTPPRSYILRPVYLLGLSSHH